MTEPGSESIVSIAADGDDLDPARHGAKACGLQRLMRLGLAVPAAVVVEISAAAEIADGIETGLVSDLFDDLANAVDTLGADETHRLAVRSGAAISLPGAFETLLDVLPEVVPEAVATVVVSTRGLRVETIARAMGVDSVPPTAVIVQRQVDATADGDSCAGVAASRDPITGEAGLFGSLAWQTRGDAVMAGTVAVDPIADLERCPGRAEQLRNDVARLDAELGQPVEVEFAVESGVLWYLQLRTFEAAEMAADQPEPTGELLGHGRPASAGVGTGELHVDVDDALDAIEAGRSVVVALQTSSPGDVPVMAKASGVLTVLGGPQSHAAVVTRSAGVPAIVAVQGLRITDDGIHLDEAHIAVGSTLIVDGSRGQIRRGEDT